MGVVKIGNIVPQVGLEPTSLVSRGSVLSLHHSLMSPLCPRLPVYAAPCLTYIYINSIQISAIAHISCPQPHNRLLCTDRSQVGGVVSNNQVKRRASWQYIYLTDLVEDSNLSCRKCMISAMCLTDPGTRSSQTRLPTTPHPHPCRSTIG